MAKEQWKPGNMLYPVPSVMVSCQGADKRPNILTVAWAGTVCSDPAMVSISVRPERFSFDLIHQSKEFVINLVTADLVYAADFCGVKSGRNVDKFKELHLTPLPSQKVAAPGIKESPVNIECRVVQEIALGTHTMFLAEVVGVTVDDRYLDEKGSFRLNDAELVTYSHGEYFLLGKKVGSFGFSVRKKPVDKELSKEEKLVNLLMRKNLHITFAESCTAGLCSGRLVNVPNASKVFDGGFVTYANEVKMKYLGVCEASISECGVVSEKVAGEMAIGAAREMNAQVGVGISGIAGPGGGTREKPVGMVCFGFFIEGRLTTKTMYFGALGRDKVRAASVEYVFQTLLTLLND